MSWPRPVLGSDSLTRYDLSLTKAEQRGRLNIRIVRADEKLTAFSELERARPGCIVPLSVT
jgi:hypothetical protein